MENQSKLSVNKESNSNSSRDKLPNPVTAESRATRKKTALSSIVPLKPNRFDQHYLQLVDSNVQGQES